VSSGVDSYSGFRLPFAALSLFTSLVVRTLPLMPRAVVWRVARRYVAGPALADAVVTVRRLNGEGAMATVDVLGEEVSERSKAEEALGEYLRVLEAIAAEKLDANVSIKPTMFGLKIDEAFCGTQIEQLVAAAHRQGTFVRIDMEDRTTTDATLRIYRRLHETYGNVGVVLQAYMRRTLADIDGLPAQGANIRLCKGIYVEPPEVAYKGFDEVRANFLAALDRLLERGVYVGIATHDEYLVREALLRVRRHGLPRERYEFQMLLGVTDPLRRRLIVEGHRLRVYVPFGDDWYAYSLRRLRENPAIAGHVTRSMLGLAPKTG
jgi:proline dehydrogenase